MPSCAATAAKLRPCSIIIAEDSGSISCAGPSVALRRAVQFTGRLLRVTVAMHNDQKLDGDGVGAAEMAKQ